jgi:pyrimidine-nucleoside phosphorylase
LKKVSDRVRTGDMLAKVYYSNRSDLDSALALVRSAYVLSTHSVEPPSTVLEVIE